MSIPHSMLMMSFLLPPSLYLCKIFSICQVFRLHDEACSLSYVSAMENMHGLSQVVLGRLSISGKFPYENASSQSISIRKVNLRSPTRLAVIYWQVPKYYQGCTFDGINQLGIDSTNWANGLQLEPLFDMRSSMIRVQSAHIIAVAILYHISDNLCTFFCVTVC